MSSQDDVAAPSVIAATVMDAPNDAALDSFQQPSQPLDDNVALTGNDNHSIELADDTDDDVVLDLTQDATENDRGNGSDNEEPNSRGSSESDSEALEFLREAGLSEEDLHSLGIDLEEIRAQRQLEKQAQRDLEYARHIQEQLDAEARQASQPSSSSSSSIPPPPPPAPASIQTPISAASSSSSSTTTMTPPTTMTPSSQIPASFAQFYPTYPFSSSSPFNPTTSYLHPSLPPMPDHHQQQHHPQVKRIKSEHPPSAIELMRQQLRNSGIGSSSSASSSSSSRDTKSKSIMVLDEDDDVIDLTNDDPGVGSSSQASAWPPNRFGVGSSSAMASSSSSSCNIFSKQFSSDDDEDDLSYYSNPYIDMINQTLNSAYLGASSSFRPFYATSVATNRANFEARYNLPYNRYAAEYVRPLNDEQTEQELRQLLESIQDHEENTTPEDRVGTPERLAVNLMEHQKVGLRWMTRQEESVNKGGMLSDDMGLGKTVQAMALIVSRPCENATPPTRVASILKKRRTDKSQMLKVKATLVVCPVSLIAQWERELVVKTRPSLKVYVHHGANRTVDERKFMDYDVVVTAYTTVANEVQELEERCGALSRVQWHRIFLDEAHQIKNRRTRMAEGCCRLESDYRWCLTATPIQNKIEELYSIIKFLRIRPYCEWKEFAEEIDRPMRKGKHKHALQKTQVLLKAISLRRSKKAKIDGKPILNLPERNVHFTHIDFSSDERQFYEFVNANAQARFNKFVEAGTVMKNYSSVLVLLLRLRQACLHPSLTMMEAPNIDSAASEEERTEVVKAMDDQVIQRLLQSDDLKEIECPICMDMADQAQIISQCGHILCRECLTNYITTGDASDKRCPQCRGPLKTEKVVPVELFLQIHAPDQYREAMEDLSAAKEKEEEEAAKNKDKVFHSSAKIDKMLEILHETRRETKNQDKTIIFSQFTSMLDLLERPLRENEFKYVRFDGTMSVANRDKALGLFFQDPRCTVLLVSTKCGSLGLNLTVANRVILMDIWWNPALENQAIDRVHRIGQKKAVDVHRIFINNTVEDRILELQRKKQAIADGALGEGSAQKIGRLGFQELLHLFRGTGLPDYGGNNDDDDDA